MDDLSLPLAPRKPDRFAANTDYPIVPCAGIKRYYTTPCLVSRFRLCERNFTNMATAAIRKLWSKREKKKNLKHRATSCHVLILIYFHELFISRRRRFIINDANHSRKQNIPNIINYRSTAPSFETSLRCVVYRFAIECEIWLS